MQVVGCFLFLWWCLVFLTSTDTFQEADYDSYATEQPKVIPHQHWQPFGEILFACVGRVRLQRDRFQPVIQAEEMVSLGRFASSSCSS